MDSSTKSRMDNSRGMSMSGHVIAYRLEEKQRFWKRILIVDDEVDITTTFRAGIEDSNNYNDSNKRIEVYTSNNPAAALSEFKLCDLLLVDINMKNLWHHPR